MFKDSALAVFIKRYPVLKSAAVFLTRVVAQFSKRTTLWMLVAVVFVMRPVWKFRFARIRSEKIGHLISETDLALALIISEEAQEIRSTNVFLMPADACNEQLRKMYLRAGPSVPTVRVLDCRVSRMARLLLPAVNELTVRSQTRGMLQSFFCGSPTSSGIVHTGLLWPRAPQLTFSRQEVEEGWRACAKLGIAPTTRYVCLHIRDDAYLQTVSPDRDWSYHNYRNPDIASYEPMVRELLDAGFWVVRMGRAASEMFPVDHERLIDYPFCEEQSDLLDVFLYAHAYLSIAGSASGIDQLGYAFGVPAVVTNLIPFEPFMPVPEVHVTPVLLKQQSSDRTMNLEEMMGHVYYTSDEYERRDVGFQRNTAEEIRRTVHEALQRKLNGWTSKDAKQQAFWKKARDVGLFRQAEIGPPGSIYATPTIGRAFLDAHWDELMSGDERSR